MMRGMPWHIQADHPSCSKTDRFAVVKNMDGKVEGCHMSRGDAEAQMAALYAQEEEATSMTRDQFDQITRDVFGGDGARQDQGQKLGGKPSKGTAKDRRLSRNRRNSSLVSPAAVSIIDTVENYDPVEKTEPVPWEGTMVVEGVPTGDGRQFASGSLTWPDPEQVPMPLQWQRVTSHGGSTDETVNIGRILSISRDGGRVIGRGIIDTDTPDGRNVAERLDREGVLGVSIVADDPDKQELEFVFPEGCPDGGPSLEDVMSGVVDDKCLSAESVIFHSGRIRALTVVDVPAFVEAQIRRSAEPVVVAAITAAAVGSHSTATADGPWDAGANEGRLPSPLPVGVAQDAYAWLDRDAVKEGNIPKASAKFLHHEITGRDGQVGAANLTAVSAGIGALHGARGGTTVPEADRRGVYNHLARHLRDADRTPPPFDLADAVEQLAAAAWTITVPDRPPADWFDEPTELPDIGAVEITAEGRLFGLLAPRSVAHRGYPDRRIEVPTGNVDYGRWQNRPVVCADGSKVAAGPITMECGHAGLAQSASATADHYDNSCSIVALARVGENRHGVWIAGALLPDVPPARVARMLACQLSGDWRPHRERPGMREFCAALLVPVPGFPVSAGHRTVRLKDRALAASAVPLRLHHEHDPAPTSPAPAPAPPSTTIQVDVRELARIVHGDIQHQQPSAESKMRASVLNSLVTELTELRRDGIA